MSEKVYKYVRPRDIKKVFRDDGEYKIKCSYPRDFNDPFELFLTTDSKLDPELLAYYAECIGEIPQQPTTCFSKSPSVTPMWSHYAEDHKGLVIEIDKEVLRKAFPDITFGDICYQDHPDENIAKHLELAFETLKPRHTLLFSRVVYHAAYFTKMVCWDYEQECRLIVPTELIDDTAGILLFALPRECITGLFTGVNATKETKALADAISASCSCSHFQTKIGRSHPSLVFTDSSGASYQFENGGLTEQYRKCASCREPIETEVGECLWCAMSDDHLEAAANRNPFRVLSKFGLLDDYLEPFNK